MKSGFLRRISIVTLVAWMLAVVGPTIIPHGMAFDWACSNDTWNDPYSGAEIEGSRASADDEHCLVCHLQRAAREALSERFRASVSPVVARANAVASDRAPIVVRSRNIPARAPPAFFL
jgi:hypothetical protein